MHRIVDGERHRRRPLLDKIYRLTWSSTALALWTGGGYITAATQSVRLLLVAGAAMLVAATTLPHSGASRCWAQTPAKIKGSIITTAVAWPALGLLRFFGMTGALAALVVVVAAPPVLARAYLLARIATDWLSWTPPQPHHDHDQPSCRAETPSNGSVRHLSDADLCHAWRSSYLPLVRLQNDRRVVAQAVLAALRQSYLDELERRDPAGFRLWLASGARPASDPTRFMTSHLRAQKARRTDEATRDLP